MLEITKPFPFDDLPTSPPIGGKIKVSDDLQQTIALLAGWDEQTRRLIRCSPTGALYTAQPRAKAVLNILADQINYVWQGGDIKTSEVLIKSNPNNADLVWVNVGVAVAANVGHPLSTGETVTLSILNLRSLHLLIAADTERVSIIYTR